MITEDYVSFEAAKLLKEKGFDEKCYLQYKENGTYIVRTESPVYNSLLDDNDYVGPTQSIAMKWLREVHEVYIEVSLSCERKDKNAKIFDASIFNIQNQRYKKLGNIQNYEQACEAAIEYCLREII